MEIIPGISRMVAYLLKTISNDFSTFIKIPRYTIESVYKLSIQYWNFFLPFLFFLSFIYWVSNSEGKIWIKNYFIPVSFFFIMFLRILVNILVNLNKNFNLQALLGLINSFFVLIFMGIVIFSYLVRSSPKKQARGFWESFFPMFVVIFHLIGSFLLATQSKSNYVSGIYLTGLVLCVIGVALNITSIWQLKKSFSIMVEVRKLVNTGVYRFLRHPLYTGEMTHLLGVCLLFNNPFAYSFFRVVIIMQLSRAKLEERKLAKFIPEYRIYKQKTGFIFPKIKIPFRRFKKNTV